MLLACSECQWSRIWFLSGCRKIKIQARYADGQGDSLWHAILFHSKSTKWFKIFTCRAYQSKVRTQIYPEIKEMSSVMYSPTQGFGLQPNNNNNDDDDIGRRIFAQSDDERVCFCSKGYLFSFNDLILSSSTTVLSRQTTWANGHSSIYIFLTNFLFPRPRYRRFLGQLKIIK